MVSDLQQNTPTARVTLLVKARNLTGFQFQPTRFVHESSGVQWEMPTSKLQQRRGGKDPAIALLEQRVKEQPDDDAALYQLAVLLLVPDPYNHYYRQVAVLRRARILVRQAIALESRKQAYHSLLGFIDSHDRKRLEAALDSMQTALRLKPNDRVLQVYVPALLAELGREREAIRELERVAILQRVDLRQHRAELRKAKMRATAENLLQAFLRPRNYLTSDLARTEERIRKALLPDVHQSMVRAIHDDCRQRQRDLRDSFDLSRVPSNIRALASAASRYGVGDDACRPLIMKRISRPSRAALRRKARTLAGPIQEWLDSFPPGGMSEEAAAYMYLLEGLDELGD